MRVVKKIEKLRGEMGDEQRADRRAVSNELGHEEFGVLGFHHGLPLRFKLHSNAQTLFLATIFNNLVVCQRHSKNLNKLDIRSVILDHLYGPWIPR